MREYKLARLHVKTWAPTRAVIYLGAPTVFACEFGSDFYPSLLL